MITPDKAEGLLIAFVLIALLVVYSAALAWAVDRISRRGLPWRDQGSTARGAGAPRSWRGASAAPQTRPVQGRDEAGRAAASRPDSAAPRRAGELLPDPALLHRAQDAARGIEPDRHDGWTRR